MNQAGSWTVMCCVGTRPEVIKMAPIIKRFHQMPWARCQLLSTAQHREMLDQALGWFGLVADQDLDIMSDNQTLPGLTANLLLRLDSVLSAAPPDIVLAQGDTTTVFCMALSCFYRDIPFGHVEAGLRTFDLRAPFPEEANRLLASRLAALHFAPTSWAQENLHREGIDPRSTCVTGNPVIDALHMTARRDVPLSFDLGLNKRMILVTAHRRENFGRPLENICKAINALSLRYDDLEVLWPVHPNPSVRPVVEGMVGSNPGVKLCQPLEYGQFVAALKRCHLVLTDSGGLQEEGPALGKPVLVMREASERPEAIDAGVARLVGTDANVIVAEVTRLLEDEAEYRRMSRGASPYGDGKAAARIVEAVQDFLVEKAS